MAHGTQARTWYGTMPVQFRYTPGAAGLRFYETLKKKGTLAATRCAECGKTYLPPRVYCENCFADLEGTWVEVEPRGRVHTFTLVHLDREGRRLRRPELAAYVRIDGTDGGLVTKLLNVRPEDVRIDLPVEGVLLPPRQRKGALDDITGFAPLGSGTPARRTRAR